MDILQGLLLLIVYRIGASEIFIEDSDEEQCNFRCNLSSGEFCLASQCVKCSYCPEDPFAVDQRGRLHVYRPCIRYGFCPKICSSYLALGSSPLANETLCEKIKKPKVPKPQTTQPASTTVYETTLSDNPYDVTIRTSERPNSPTQVVDTTNINNVSKDVPVWISVISNLLVAVFVCASVKLYRKYSCWKKSSSPNNHNEAMKMFPRTYEQLEIQLDDQNKTATVKGLKGLNCSALQLCACFGNPDSSAQDWIPIGGLDEMQLPGPMIPHEVYTVKAGKVSTIREFECIAVGKVKTEEFANVILHEACSTTLKDIFGNLSLRRSLQAELYVNCSSQRDITDIIATALKLKEDEFKGFKGERSLGKLYDDTITANDSVDSSVHNLMEGLVNHSEAKDFVRKIAKRDTNRYCKKCLGFLHRMCCGNHGDNSEVVNEFV